MTHGRILVVYATSYGQTEKIAQRIAGHLTGRLFDVTLADARNLPADLHAETFDGIVLGASIIARGHQPSIKAFINANAATLSRTPSAFFSVCASAGSAYEKNRHAAAELRDAFLRETSWQPGMVASIAGAINFTRYNFLLRWYMKKASRLNGGSTDTSRDHEYTDWGQVARFAAAFAEMLTPVSA